MSQGYKSLWDSKSLEYKNPRDYETHYYLLFPTLYKFMSFKKTN